MFACHALERYRRQNFYQQTELGELTRRFEELSIHDPLTGLRNRRQLSDQLRDTVEQFHRYGTLASVMLIDLDDFKAINDRFGHLAGDELLKRTANLILEFLRKTDRAYRYGGDEFLVLLPNTSLPEAKTLADRLVDRFARHTHVSSYFATVCGISVGVASLNSTTQEADDVLYAADRALYEAKQRGKGCVVASGSG
jgi:diguanylate cyclase (GGDEF)-like protein